MTMERACRILLLVVAVTAMLGYTAFAKGGSIGIYAIVDKVVLEPDEANPERIRIWGTFIVPVRRSSGAHQRPQRGYLYYSLPTGREEVVKREWLELKSVAGTGRAVGFAAYWMLSSRTPGAHTSLEVRVRQDGDTTAPDVYPRAIGVLERDDGNNPEFDRFIAELEK
jgi:hypothetical protein